MARLEVPVIACIIGEGGSGGALGIAAGNYVLMMENAIYTVITPEGCSAILWKDQEHVEVAADALKITATDLKSFEIVDEIVGHLNDICETSFKTSTPLTQQLIATRMKEGYEIEDFKKVHVAMSSRWKNDPRMCHYLRPLTLYSNKFESYLNNGNGTRPVKPLSEWSPIERKIGKPMEIWNEEAGDTTSGFRATGSDGFSKVVEADHAVDLGEFFNQLLATFLPFTEVSHTGNDTVGIGLPEPK